MLNTTLILKLLGDSMKSLIGLKNMIMFSAVLLTIGSVSAQQAFAGSPLCVTNGPGNWNNIAIWDNCSGNSPTGGENASVEHDIRITGNEEANYLTLEKEGGTLFIDCDASLNLFDGGMMGPPSNITNHGTFTSDDQLFSFYSSTFFNSGEYSGLMPYVGEGGVIVEISSICDRPIGGTVGSMSTTSLLVAGAQTNMGLWSLALVGIVGAGAAIIYKVKSNKTEE